MAITTEILRLHFLILNSPQSLFLCTAKKENSISIKGYLH